MNKNLSEYKRKYDVTRHHAWAGSVILAVLVTIRGFLELSKIDVNDWIIVALGLILVFYVLISVVFTYRYRAGLSSVQKNVVEVKIESDNLEKERLKAEKKKAKSEAKKAKKTNKK